MQAIPPLQQKSGLIGIFADMSLKQPMVYGHYYYKGKRYYCTDQYSSGIPKSGAAEQANQQQAQQGR